MQKIKTLVKKLIVPSENNNFRARFLHTDMLTVYLVLAIVFSVVFRSSLITSVFNVLGIATDITVEKLYQLTNEEREKNGLKDLKLNQELSLAAQKKAEDMFTKNYWAHFGPNGETPWNFIVQSGYQYEHAGENLAKNFMFSNGVVNAWINSPTHKENLLRPVYTDVGFAVVNGVLNNEETTLVVQMFGTPKTGVFQQIADNITPPVPNNQIGGVAKINPEKQMDINQIDGKKVNRSIPFSITIGFAIFLLFVFLADLIIAQRMGILRLTGNHFAHALFLLTIIAAVLLLKRGTIL